ncbi:MAG: glycoside hydrolase family 3 protein, partial [Lachnospiraceae bacterium]|nr:glycoside hydrolase family 3 protein [Lachnospiraceae bacterium]
MENRFIMNWEEYARIAREAAAEGAVLLENKDAVLPIKKGEKIAVFGRDQLNYYKSGTGSGGMVNTRYVVSILDALLNEKDLTIDEELLETYREFVKTHPFDAGNGWATEPSSQEEMPLSDEILNKAKVKSDKAIIIIGRLAGEDKDTPNEPGGYFLSKVEEEMIEKVCKTFDKTIVLLNSGSIFDMSWVKKYNPKAVMYVWQGGMEGGNAVLDVLTGRVNPSGHLTDTIAEDINDYSSTANFSDKTENIYAEDIYLGYRYFETFAKDKVLYPFGYGLSYTTFETSDGSAELKDNKLFAKIKVKNTGDLPGKEVIQVYLKAPQGKLGKPARVLIGFKKTKLLNPGETEELNFEIKDETWASFDDSGVTGYRFSYLYEAGNYRVYAGNNVRSASLIGEFSVERDVIIRKCESALAPVKPFKRIKPGILGGDEYVAEYEDAPTRTYEARVKSADKNESEYEYTGDFGYKLSDVYDKKVSLSTFISQLDDIDLRCIVRGEGMCSARVTPGTAAAFGGVSDRLNEFGIPAGCLADGPSGIRMDCGTKAFAMPNGTCLACTYNEELNVRLYEWEGRELRKNRIDALLGPGINIHRNPLNGRNFEYFSEDPLVTGRMAVAQLKGMSKYNVTGVIKHFACNNQETARHSADSVVSERALREIYLKGYEMAVKEGGAYMVMTTYGPLNGVWTAGSYELNTSILRNEWGFDGMVMTDWWAKVNTEGTKPSVDNLADMVLSGNDVYMVIRDALANEDI